MCKQPGSERLDRGTLASDCAFGSAGSFLWRAFSLQPHIMVNLNGYTNGGRLELFALKCAPIQVRLACFFYAQYHVTRVCTVCV